MARAVPNDPPELLLLCISVGLTEQGRHSTPQGMGSHAYKSRCPAVHAECVVSDHAATGRNCIVTHLSV